jgi:hypothetical protein
MKTNPRDLAFLSVVLGALLGSCGAGRDEPTGRSCDCGFRTIVYDEPFGARFGLPERGVRRLDQGLSAVALRVYELPGSGYTCEIDLYVASGLNTALVENADRGRIRSSSSKVIRALGKTAAVSNARPNPITWSI